ncbi:MAG: M1 family metallopeptidase [Clostridia bacterium]|nr:M1 family metallopeptidase [Clostridia bacterium]
MKRFHILLSTLAVSLVAGLCAAAILMQGPLFTAPTLAEREPNDAYDMYLNLNPATGDLYGRMTLTVPGRAWQDAPGDLWFHLYPNYFAGEKTLPVDERDMPETYPLGFSPGSVTIETLRLDGAEPDYTLARDDTLLCVPLNKPLAEGEQTEVFMEFTVKLPHNRYRFGQNELGLNFTFFHPQLACYDGVRWHTDLYFPIGDPFVFPVADYDIELHGAQGHNVAAGGEVAWEGDVCRITGRNMRDCAVVLGKGYEVETEKVGKITIYSFSKTRPKSQASNPLTIARAALAAFEKRFGPYPFATYTVVETGLRFYGMEYAGLVQIDTSLYDEGRAEELEYTVVHETAHQWFYAAVGSDQVMQPWLDEALAEYATVSHLGLWDKQRNMYNYAVASGQLEPDVSAPAGGTLSDYGSAGEYAALVYMKGSLIMKELADELGESVFDRALKDYVGENLFGMGTREAFLNSVYRCSGKDYSQWLAERLDGEKTTQNQEHPHTNER